MTVKDKTFVGQNNWRTQTDKSRYEMVLKHGTWNNASLNYRENSVMTIVCWREQMDQA